jgi:hypothetical protein
MPVCSQPRSLPLAPLRPENRSLPLTMRDSDYSCTGMQFCQPESGQKKDKGDFKWTAFGNEDRGRPSPLSLSSP